MSTLFLVMKLTLKMSQFRLFDSFSLFDAVNPISFIRILKGMIFVRSFSIKFSFFKSSIKFFIFGKLSPQSLQIKVKIVFHQQDLFFYWSRIIIKSSIYRLDLSFSFCLNSFQGTLNLTLPNLMTKI